jgi:hypothetical protein
MGLRDLLRLQKAEAEERLDRPDLTPELRALDQAYLAELERLISAG